MKWGKDFVWVIVPLVAVAGMSGYRVVKGLSSSGELEGMEISGIVVPHHDLMEVERREVFREVAARGVSPKTVVVVSPNHFSQGTSRVVVSNQVWTLGQNEVLEPDTDVVNQITESGIAEEFSTITNEHGIGTMLLPIKQYFPQAKIVPVLLSDSASEEDEQVLIRTLNSVCPDCFVVASVDFSHYQPALLSDLHDVRSIRALSDLERDNASSLEVDSPRSLQLLMDWAKSKGTERFVLQNHTNTGQLMGDPDLETTTHVYGWYERGGKEVQSGETTLVFAQGLGCSTDPIKRLSTFGDRVLWGADAPLLVSSVGKTLCFRETEYLHARAVGSQDIVVSEAGAPKVAVVSMTSLSIPDFAAKVAARVQSGSRVIALVSRARVLLSSSNAQWDDWAKAAVDAGADLVLGTETSWSCSPQLVSGVVVMPCFGSDVTMNQAVVLGVRVSDSKLSYFLLPYEVGVDTGTQALTQGASKRARISADYDSFSNYIVHSEYGDIVSVPLREHN